MDFLDQQEAIISNINDQYDIIINVINTLTKARDNGNKIYTMGNGGSASTASHFTADLLKTVITKNEKRLQVISLVDNLPVLLAWANDVSYEDIFNEQLQNFLSKGDIVIGFSGSGKSSNVVRALKYAKKNGAVCIGFTGMSGGYFPKICDICVLVPSNDMLIIESTHVILCHCIISAIRNMGKPIFRYD